MTYQYKIYLFELIIHDIGKLGLSLRKASEKRMSIHTFYAICDTNNERMQQYARACEQRADIIFDEMLEIADTPVEGVVIETDDNGRTKEKKGDMLGHRRLQIEARKWALSKMNPKKYGDKIKVDNTIKTIGAEASDESYV